MTAKRDSGAKDLSTSAILRAIMRIAMTYPPWLAQAYAKAVDPERGSRRQRISKTSFV
jgi:hypothetical protein